ncbi:MAG: 16S rRNA (guanine(966)-N(2))-methyltransferase RsmD [Verrucomicrobiota bacterium]
MKGAGRIRISGGINQGLFIHSPPQFHSRPTQDKVRQAIFSSLGSIAIEATVLDLYAGSGALGIEALSRGAERCTFVDHHFNCIKTIKSNLDYCKLNGVVTKSDALRFCQRSDPDQFDLIFLDPPYIHVDKPLDEEPILSDLRRMLRPEGRIIWEHPSRQSWNAPEKNGLLKTAKYGDSSISYISKS